MLVEPQGEGLLQRELATVGPMPRLETMKNSNVFSWGEAYFELCSERPLGLRLPRKIRRDTDP